MEKSGPGLNAERYAFLVEESGVVISTHRPGDWAFTSANGRFYELLGYHPQELMGVPVYFFFHPKDAESMKQRNMPAVRVHGTRTFRYRFRHRDGHYRWLESTHRSIRDPETDELREVIAVSRDLTPQLEAEATARRMAMVTESSTDLVLFCDQTLRLNYMNESARQALGLESSVFPPLEEIFSTTCVRELEELIRRSERDDINWLGNWSIELSASSSRALELQEIQRHGEDYLQSGDRFYGLIIREVTAQRHAERIERERHQELARAARLMTLGEMATGLAHEINQPLATILNYSRGALRRIENGQLQSLVEVEPVLQQVARQAQRAADIIKRLRSMIRKTPFQRQRINLNEVCRDVAGFLQHELQEAKVTLEFLQEDDLPCIDADIVQIEQVMVNLLRNSLEAYRGRRISGSIALQTRSTESLVCLSITDWAGGISEEQQQHLFEPYYTSKKSGLGLGLSICRSIVEAHSGRIRVESDAQSSSRVELCLPVTGAQ